MKKIIILILLASGFAHAQQVAPLTVEKIMRDTRWIGTSPTNYRWSEDSKTVFFDWNPKGEERPSAYKANVLDHKPVSNQVGDEDNEEGRISYTYNKNRSMALYEKEGDIYFYHVKSKKEFRLTTTVERESAPRFLIDNQIVFQRGDNFFQLNLNSNELKQLTNFVKGSTAGSYGRSGEEDGDDRSAGMPSNPQDEWLQKDQLGLFDLFKKYSWLFDATKMAETNKKFQKNSSSILPRYLSPILLDDQPLSDLNINPTGRFVTYKVTTAVKNHHVIVPNYVTFSGYTQNEDGQPKVGETLAASETFIYDVQKDTLYKINVSMIPGIKDLPDYVKDYPDQLKERTRKNEDRKVDLSVPLWNEDGNYAIVIAKSFDNKDRWILKLDAATGNLSLLDRQRDEAWIDGPGITEKNVSWIDHNRIYYQSEATGYAHLYVLNVATGEKKQLTSGKWEVQTLELSKDKKIFYLTANREHPGVTHLYKIGVNGGALTQITSMKGKNEVTISPDEKWLAINYSFTNKPWELYIQANKPGAKAVRVTKSTTTEFDSYPWREAEIVTFKNRYGKDIYARVYPATNPHPNKPAVVFAHGAGYLQNVYYGWSYYFREYMFHNLLADNGYTVIDIDFTASAGYGRDHRAGIYRDMGNIDLTDNIDGVKMLVEKYGVHPKHVGIYGGSYGGFLTLMGMFKAPQVFAAGAALRAVTDWAHYNHTYTSNILNEPYNDPNAYKRSSAIYYADQLKGSLLMAHGVVDMNVNFQDIVRLSQRFIELGKDNWDLAIYPVEDHGFEQPSSWTDEYKRIFRLFETTLKKNSLPIK